MRDTLDASDGFMKHDPRVLRSISTILSHFTIRYAQEFAFENRSFFGETNGALRQKINFQAEPRRRSYRVAQPNRLRSLEN